MAEDLTDTKIRGAKPKEKAYRLYDKLGLYLEVSPKGSKLWRVKYRFQGRENRLGLGKYPAVSLADARARVLELKAIIAEGRDPSAVRKEEKAAVAAVVVRARTFKDVALEWYGKNSGVWTEKHRHNMSIRLEKHVFPYIGDRPIVELKTTDFVTMLHHVEATGHIQTAHLVAQLCGRVTRYAALVGILDADPASGLSAAVAAVKTRHYPVITEPMELGKLLRAIWGYGGEPSTRYALKIMPYVFLRRNELCGGLWREIDLDKGLWTIPAARMKMRRKHVVPLARQAVELLQEARAYAGGSEFVFPSAQGGKHCHPNTLFLALRSLGYTKDKLCVHSFRGIASTILHGQGFDSQWVEMQLSHVDRNKVRDSYNHADFLDQRRGMMQMYADYLDTLRNAV